MTRIRPILRWPGGKSRMLPHILPLIRPHVCYCEPFAGGLAVLGAKERSAVEVVNDINGNLIALLRNLQFHLPALMEEIDWLFSSRQNPPDFNAQPGLTEIQRASRFLLVNRTSFGGNMKSFGVAKTKGGGVNFDKAQIAKLLLPMRERLNGVVIENTSYERCLVNYDSKDTQHFIDPPYLGTKQSAYGSWTEADLRFMKSRVEKLQGHWIVTLNDVPFTRELFSDCNILGTSTVGRLAKNKDNQTRLEEIIITPK